MEFTINRFLFPAPKCEYTEATFQELIWVPVHQKQPSLPKRQSSQLQTRVTLPPLLSQMSCQQILKSQPDNDPITDVSQSIYDQDVDENIDSYKSPKKIMRNYQSAQNSCVATQKVSAIYRNVAKMASYQRSES